MARIGVPAMVEGEKNLQVLVDGNNLAWQAFHALPELSADRVRTEVIFGFLYRIFAMAKFLRTKRFLFFWDSTLSKGKRKGVYPEYKESREEPTFEKKMCMEQIVRLRGEVIPAMGFRNSFRKEGYEADDLIAYAHFRLVKRKIICSEDGDFQQLLGDETVIYRPRKKRFMTSGDWSVKYQGLHPRWMAEIKAIAGCKGDDVPGIEMVGEVLAAKYLVGRLNAGKTLEKITSKEGQALIKRNRELVCLPFGVSIYRYSGWDAYDDIKLSEDETTKRKFIRVFEKYRFMHFLKRSNLDGIFKIFFPERRVKVQRPTFKRRIKISKG